MAASEVEICNIALTWLGASPIGDLLEPSEEAILCNANYIDTRDATLAAAAWSFATVRNVLTPSAQIPVWGYGNSFDIPLDSLRIIEASNDALRPNGANNLDWRQEGQQIVSDADKIWIKYIARITDVTLFAPTFTHTFAARLAAILSPTVTESNTKTETLWNLYGQYLGEAMAVDGSQGKSDRIRGRSLTSMVR